MRQAVLLCGSAHPNLGQRISERLDMLQSPVSIERTLWNETELSIGVSVRNKDVYIIQTGACTDDAKSMNDYFMELLIMVHASRHASASRIIAVMPYFPYSKVSKKKSSRGPITAKLVADMLMSAGASHVITMDLHAPPIQSFFTIPVDNLLAEPLVAKSIRELSMAFLAGIQPNLPETDDANTFECSPSSTESLPHKNLNALGFSGLCREDTKTDGKPESFDLATDIETLKNIQTPITTCPYTPSRCNKRVSSFLLENLLEDSESQVSESIHGLELNSNFQMNGASDPCVDCGSYAPPLPISPSNFSLKEQFHNDVVLIARNASETKRVSRLADKLQVDFAILYSTKSEDLVEESGSSLKYVGNNLTGKLAWIVGDIIDDPMGYLNAVDLVKKQGAKFIAVSAVHPLLTKANYDLLEGHADIDLLLFTNTIPLTIPYVGNGRREKKCKILDVSPLIAEAIRRVHNGESVSSLFYKEL